MNIPSDDRRLIGFIIGLFLYFMLSIVNMAIKHYSNDDKNDNVSDDKHININDHDEFRNRMNNVLDMQYHKLKYALKSAPFAIGLGFLATETYIPAIICLGISITLCLIFTNSDEK